MLCTEDNISAGVVNKEHGLVVGLLPPALQNVIQVVNGPGPFHQVDPGLLKAPLHRGSWTSWQRQKTGVKPKEGRAKSKTKDDLPTGTC